MNDRFALFLETCSFVKSVPSYVRLGYDDLELADAVSSQVGGHVRYQFRSESFTAVVGRDGDRQKLGVDAGATHLTGRFGCLAERPAPDPR